MKAGDNLGNSGNINLASPEYARGYKKGYRNGHSIGFEAGKKSAMESMEDLGEKKILDNPLYIIQTENHGHTLGRKVHLYAIPVQKDQERRRNNEKD